MNRDIIKVLIGKVILEIRVMSFFINRNLVCEIIVFYVKTSDLKWYKFTTSDGVNVVEFLPDEPQLTSLDSINDDFAYPIKSIQNNYINCQIFNIKEYMWQGKKDESNGFYFEFEDNKNFSLFEDDGCLIIIDGIWFDENFSLY
ncbi:MAG: hypothetical protein E2604_13630 [Flavobacterium sp.]|nr:hypothetical protein [Flavobacterium sp.]